MLRSQPRNAVAARYDYSYLDRSVAERVRAAAGRISQHIKQSVAGIIAIGLDLRHVKALLPHGDFLPWVHTEFEWTERTARYFMAVAEHFGPKAETISDLAITPTAAYLLTAPSTPDEARQAAIARAEAGDKITTAVAKELVARARKKVAGKGRLLSGEKLVGRLEKVLQRIRQSCRPDDLPAFARQLHAFADSVERGQPGRGRQP